jgi:hypothetical protein
MALIVDDGSNSDEYYEDKTHIVPGNITSNQRVPKALGWHNRGCLLDTYEYYKPDDETYMGRDDADWKRRPDSPKPENLDRCSENASSAPDEGRRCYHHELPTPDSPADAPSDVGIDTATESLDTAKETFGTKIENPDTAKEDPDNTMENLDTTKETPIALGTYMGWCELSSGHYLDVDSGQYWAGHGKELIDIPNLPKPTDLSNCTTRSSEDKSANTTMTDQKAPQDAMLGLCQKFCR